MPHTRVRFILERLLKKLNYSRVVTIQGARQTGKSFFAREILTKSLRNARYVTFDQDNVRKLAGTDIETFLSRHSESKPLVIDEAQKVPAVFDGVKFIVDQNNARGQFVLLGSTEFSHPSQVREALTGRTTLVRFFPLTLAEAWELPYSDCTSSPFYLNPKTRLSKTQFLKQLESGGLPGIFAIREERNKHEAIRDWIDLTVQRDLHQFPRLKLDSGLALDILKSVATLSEPTGPKIAKHLTTDLRRIKTHIAALEGLFALIAIPPHRLGTGQPLYVLLDSGVASFLGASRLRALETLFVQEYLAKRELDPSSNVGASLFYYRTTKGTRLSFVEERAKRICAVQILDAPTADKRKFYALSHFVTKAKAEFGKNNVVPCVWSPSESVAAPKGVRIFTWESAG